MSKNEFLESIGCTSTTFGTERAVTTLATQEYIVVSGSCVGQCVDISTGETRTYRPTEPLGTSDTMFISDTEKEYWRHIATSEPMDGTS